MAAAQLSPGPGSVAARLTSARLTMLDNGWRPTPVSGKVCYLPGWGTFCDEPPSRAKVAAWATDRLTASHLSTGAALSQNEVVIDLDAMDLVRAQTLEALADHLFGWSPFRRIGRWPRLALFFRAAEPIPYTSVTATDGSGDGIEVHSHGRQTVCFGLHPDTRKRYEWVGDENPLTAGPEAAPAITLAQVNHFLAAVRTFMPWADKPVGMPTRGPARPRGRKAKGLGSSSAKDPVAGDAEDQPGAIIRDAAGLVVDQREAHLAASIWWAAQRLHENGAVNGAALEPRVLAALGWERFTGDHRPHPAQ